MAEFCKQCGSSLFGPEYSDDFKGLISEERVQDGYFAQVICEGCGPTYVDHEGKCIYSHCMMKHGEADDKSIPRASSRT